LAFSVSRLISFMAFFLWLLMTNCRPRAREKGAAGSLGLLVYAPFRRVGALPGWLSM